MNFIEKLKGIIKPGSGMPPFDPSKFNDNVALKTEWTPAKAGGTNMCTHSLKDISPNRFEFKARGIALLFPGAFMVAGIGVLVGMTIGGLKHDINMLLWGIPFGSIFIFVGFFIQRSWLTPRIFDNIKGYYWKGKGEPNDMNPQNIKDQCRLRDIYAIQVLQENCRSSSSSGGSSSYYSYELNLVLKDGSRLNVIDHGKPAAIRSDADKLGRFIGVTVWDSTL